MREIMQTVTVNFEDGKKPTGKDYINEVNRVIKQPIREAIQTLYDQEGIEGARASRLRRKAIDVIVASLKRWEQIDARLSKAVSKSWPDIPESITRFALPEDQERKTVFISEKLSTIDNLLDAFDPGKDISEGTAPADLIWSFTETVNETANRIHELLHEGKNAPIDAPNSVNWTPHNGPQ